MIKRSTLSNILLYFALLCLGINYILYNALGIEEYKVILRIIGILLMLATWAISGKRTLTLMQGILLAISSIALMLNGTESINLLALVIIGIAMGTDEEGAEKAYKVNLFLFVLVLAFLALGVMHNEMWYGGTEVIRKVRWTLGFGNPNHATAFFTSFFCLYVITRGNINKWNIIIPLILEAGVFYMTNSRTWFVAYIVFSMIMLIMMHTNKLQNFLQNSCVVLIDSFFFAHLFLRNILGFLMRFDVLLSFRISRFQAELAHFGIKEYLIGGGTVSVDSMYINLLYGYGVIVYLIIWLAVHITMTNLKRENNYKMLAFLSAMLIAGLMESSAIRPEFMSSVIIWTVVLYNCHPRRHSREVDTLHNAAYIH